MQVYCNEKYVKSRAKLGRYASFAGMGVLLVGLIITWTAGPEGLTLSFLALIGGFILSQVGLYYANRFGRPERPDKVLAKSLKGFDDRYNLFQYTCPAGNVLVTPSACCVFTVKMQRGSIRYQNGKWKNPQGFRSFFLWLASDSLGNPTKEAEIDADTLRRYVAKKLPEWRYRFSLSSCLEIRRPKWTSRDRRCQLFTTRNSRTGCAGQARAER